MLIKNKPKHNRSTTVQSIIKELKGEKIKVIVENAKNVKSSALKRKNQLARTTKMSKYKKTLCTLSNPISKHKRNRKPPTI